MNQRKPKTFPASMHSDAYPEAILLINAENSTRQKDADSLSAIAARTYALSETLISHLHDREDSKKAGNTIPALNEGELIQQIVYTAPERIR
ncbi:MAG: hypothetical protein P8X89_22485 [Reinekea sp.]